MSKSSVTRFLSHPVLASRLGAQALFALSLLVGAPVFATDEADLQEAEGVVQEVSVAESKVLITGIRYEVEPHANVQVRGTSSSIAALLPGMKVRFLYEVIEGFDAEIAARKEASVISRLEQLPDSHVIVEF